MRAFRVAFATGLCLFAAGACSPAPPPSGRWQGAYESRDVMVITRLEIDSKEDIFLSAPDATDIAAASAEDRVAIRQRLVDGLSVAWGETRPRHFDFDGRIFRKPGGVAPQLEWDPDNRRMTAIVYLRLRPALRVPLHAVADFSGDPRWIP